MNDTTRDELVERVEAVTGYTRGKGGWEMDVSHTNKVYADIDGLIAEIEQRVTAARDAEIREALMAPGPHSAIRRAAAFHIGLMAYGTEQEAE